MKNSEKLLAQGTRPRYDAPMDESWNDIPGLSGYEVSTQGRVRKWMTKDGKARPVLYKGLAVGDSVQYSLQGERYTIDDLMLAAFGDEAGDMDISYDPRDRDRELSQYEVNEIRLQEGYKTAFEVAAEFRIDPERVRRVWDS